jgi:hypothetical protein
MSTLRSALDELRSSDVLFLSDEEIVSDLDELERATRVIEVERRRRLAEVERRGSYAVDGHLSMASWLASRHPISHAAAASHARLSRALEQMPVAAEALACGEVSTSAVGLLAAARDACPEEFALSEAALVDAASALPVAQLKGAVAYWRETADPARADANKQAKFEGRRLFASATLDGMVRVDGDLDPVTGQFLLTALRAVEDADVRSRWKHDEDSRTPAQRRADALGEVCRQWLDLTDRPTVAGERPHVVVTIDLDTLEGRVGRRCELEDTGRIGGETARMLACDANVTRVITHGDSMPLDVGRKTKVVSPSLRRALAIRDGGCAFPGCARPPSWCDAHRLPHWNHGGATALGKLALLCRRHHRLVHHGRFRIDMVNERPRFFRADGTELDRGG